jgi:hypothetical protein
MVVWLYGYIAVWLYGYIVVLPGNSVVKGRARLCHTPPINQFPSAQIVPLKLTAGAVFTHFINLQLM